MPVVVRLTTAWGEACIFREKADGGTSYHCAFTVDNVAGNIVGSREGSDPALKPLMLGSHIDSVPMSGNYDGDVGSLGAIEVAQVLNERGIRLRHPLEICIFQAEERGHIGSKALGEGLTDAQLSLVWQSGTTVRDGMRLLGGDPNRVASAHRERGGIAGYFELHIEQDIENGANVLLHAALAFDKR